MRPRPARYLLSAVPLVVMLVAVALLTALTPSAAEAASKRPRVTVKYSGALVAGRKLQATVKVRPRLRRATVSLQQRRNKRWRNVAARRLPRNGTARVTWKTSSQAKRVIVRVQVRRGRRVLKTTKARKLELGAPSEPSKPASGGGGGTPPADPSPPPGGGGVVPGPPGPPAPPSAPGTPAGPSDPAVQAPVATIQPQSVRALPAPDEAGEVVLDGFSDVRPGDLLNATIGPKTPFGFLGKVTATRTEGQTTVISTEPIALPDAVPEGGFDVTIEQPEQTATATAAALESGSAAGRRSRAAGTCKSSAGFELTPPTVSFDQKLRFKADWSLLRGGLQRASIAAEVSAVATTGASADAGVSCTLSALVARFQGAPVPVQVGPLTVVLVPTAAIDLSARAEAQADVKADVKATATATAGMTWDRGQISPISAYSPTFQAAGPTVTGTAGLGVTVTPKVNVLVYGGGGPQMTFAGGLDLAAVSTADPFWKLTAPVELTAQLVVPRLKLSTPNLRVYERTFEIARASGPGPGVDPGDGGGGTGGGDGGGEDDGGPTPPTSTPTSGRRLAAGWFYGCARRTGGTVACWGTNDAGQLGDGTKTGRATPGPVSGLSDAVQVAAGFDHTCALRAPGSVTCWGKNDRGQLGNGDKVDSSTPVPVSGLDDAIEIDVDQVNSCALRASGKVVCWGDNFYGQLGNGKASVDPPGVTEDSAVPVEVVGLADAVEVTVNFQGACARRAAGAVVCWGHNQYGKLGDGSSTSCRRQSGWSGLRVVGRAGCRRALCGVGWCCSA